MAHYEITVLEVGFDAAFPLGVAFDFWNHADETAYSPFTMTLLKGEGHTILFDCGLSPADPYCAARIQMENDQNCHDPAEVLRSIGIMPEEVDIVILSHCHWDHISGMQYLPNAKFYLQTAEYTGWLRAMEDPDFPATHKSVINPAALERVKAYAEAGRLTFFEGDVEDFLPGIDVVAASGHSFCQTMLFINNDGRHYAVIGDVCMRPESFTGTEAFPGFLPNLKFATGSITDISASYRKILNWVDGDMQRVIMSHDGTRKDAPNAKRSELGLQITPVF